MVGRTGSSGERDSVLPVGPIAQRTHRTYQTGRQGEETKVSDDFGPVAYIPITKDADGREVVRRSDITKHRTFVESQFQQHPDEWVSITIPTGPLFGSSDFPTGKVPKSKKGRGRAEYGDFQGFEKAAEELGLTIRIVYRHNSATADETPMTTFTMRIRPKKVLTPDEKEKKVAGLARGRLKKLEEAAKAAQEAAKADPQNEQLVEAAKLAVKKYNDKKKSANGAAKAPATVSK